LWVDGDDPKWIAERDKYYKGELNQKKGSAYRDWGTLQYWFRAVEKYAPWVNKIHFVTAGHLPNWLNTNHPLINVVKHADFIPLEYLPTFSANSIELNIHRIPGLAEQFVYFNDDTFIVAPVNKEDFFYKGLPCDSAVMSALIPSVKNEIFTYILFNDLLLVNSYFNKKECFRGNYSKWFSLKYGKHNLKNLYYYPIGKFSGFQNWHLPNAYRKTIWREVWEQEYETLEKTISRRFRTRDDVNQYIFRYWQLCKGEFIPRNSNIGCCYVIGADDQKIEKAIHDPRIKLICMNDNPEDIDFVKEKEWLIRTLQTVFPQKSSFER